MVVFKKISIVWFGVFFLNVFSIMCCEKSTITIIKNNTLCPFAKHAHIRNNNFFWDSSKTITENVNTFISKDLHQFVIESTKEGAKLDALALEIPANKYAYNIEIFAAVFRNVLMTINKDCIMQLEQLEPDGNEMFWDDGWQFTYNGKELFVIGLAPFYDKNHSRYIYGAENAVILFQPEASFKRCLPKNENARFKRRQRIRDSFAKKGQEYAANKILIELGSKKDTHTAPRFLKPLKFNDKLIEWWNTKKYPEGAIDGD